jgi:predicted Zn finger-like uncharacterized protein
MSNITQCPHCKTRFRIQPEQLEARRGLVCCGRCQHAFNARSNLMGQPEALAVAPTPVPESSEQIPLGVSTEATVVEPEALAAELMPAVETASPAATPDKTLSPEPSSPAAGLEQTAPVEAMAESESQTVEPLIEEASIERVVEPPSSETIENRVGVVSISGEFLQPTSPARREWLIIAAVVILALLLLAQLVYAFRVELAARMPGVRPALEGYCRLLKCEIPLPRQAELLSLESSGLEASPEGDKWVVLTAVVRNRAAYVQACPELLLTLTDQSDTPLVRKTFRPEEYLPAERRAGARLESGEDLDIRLELELQDVKPVGYRLLLYYP